jgi:hypothetical protein
VPAVCVWRKPDHLPERKACGSRIDGNQPASAHASESCLGQLAADTTSPCWSDVEASHAHGIRYDRVDREATDTNEHIVYTGGEHSFPLMIEAYCARLPVAASRQKRDELVTATHSDIPRQ